MCDAAGGLSAVVGALICGAVSGAANWTNQVANNLVGSVFNGSESSGLNLAGEIIASTFMEVNSSMIQLVIDIFPK